LGQTTAHSNHISLFQKKKNGVAKEELRNTTIYDAGTLALQKDQHLSFSTVPQ